MRAWIVAWSLLVASHSFADARVFERGRDERTGEITRPQEHRFVDLTALLQPGLLLRLADGDARGVDGTDEVHLHRARLGIDAVPIWWARLKLEVELANGDPALTDAFVEFRPHDAIHVTIGRFAPPFLLAYRFHESNLGFVDRPLYTPLAGQRSVLNPLTARETGLRLSGRIGDLSRGATSPVFEYALAAMTLPPRDDRSFEDGSRWAYAGRLVLHVLGVSENDSVESDLARNTVPRIALGGGIYSSCRADWHRGFTADVELRWQGLYVSGAYVWLKNGPAADGQLGYGACEEGPTLGEPRTVSSGAHAQVAYVLPERLFPVRNQALEVMARFDWVLPQAPFDPERRLRGGTPDHPDFRTAPVLDAAERARLTFSLTWYPVVPTPLRVQLAYQHHREWADSQDTDEREVWNDVVWLLVTASL